VDAGAFHFPRYLDLNRQRALVDECRALIDGATPAYVPVVRGGGKMHVRMLCLGRHWNGMTYRYEPSRSDFDGLPAPALPESFRRVAAEVARAASMTLEADICILNYYDNEGRMGLHQDKDESPESIAAAFPWCRSRSATRRAFSSAAPDDGIRLSRSCSGRATPLSSAVQPGFVIMVSHASFQRPRRLSCSSLDD
jgi:hypothetical protein